MPLFQNSSGPKSILPYLYYQHCFYSFLYIFYLKQVMKSVRFDVNAELNRLHSTMLSVLLRNFMDDSIVLLLVYNQKNKKSQKYILWSVKYNKWYIYFYCLKGWIHTNEWHFGGFFFSNWVHAFSQLKMLCLTSPAVLWDYLRLSRSSYVN